ncbi:sensor histidine kinase [Nonomuraea sp. NPDC050790]|uniref:sensor histidine kinase n=1 Tax=Nonomuraea sp. NPDC050790 TaxID=3364371 RepID=UPI00379866E8
MEPPSRLRSLGIAALSPLVLCAFALAPGIVGMVVLGVLRILPSGSDRLAVWMGCLVGVVGLHVWVVVAALRRRGAAWLPLAGQAALTVAPLMTWTGWSPVTVLLTGSLLVVAERKRSWVLVVLALSCGPLLLTVVDAPWLLAAPILGFAEYAVLSLTIRAHSLRAVLTDQVCRAVEDERHRLTRDLHDLVGHRLTLLILRIELAQRQLEKSGARGREELDEALELVRGVTEDVRSVAHLGRSYSLETELSSARSVLESAGVNCHVHVACGGLPQSAIQVLTYVLREGVTNILRHTTARECSIQVLEEGGMVLLSILNDGAKKPRHAPGHGLRNLRERVVEYGGWFEARAMHHGRFRMSVYIPGKLN